MGMQQHDVKGVVSGTSEEWQEWMSELKMVQVTPGKQGALTTATSMRYQVARCIPDMQY